MWSGPKYHKRCTYIYENHQRTLWRAWSHLTRKNIPLMEWVGIAQWQLSPGTWREGCGKPEPWDGYHPGHWEMRMNVDEIPWMPKISLILLMDRWSRGTWIEHRPTCSAWMNNSPLFSDGWTWRCSCDPKTWIRSMDEIRMFFVGPFRSSTWCTRMDAALVRELDEWAMWMKVGLSYGETEKRALTQGPQNKLSWDLDEGPQSALIHHHG